MSEDIWSCVLYGKVHRLHELASAGVTFGPAGEVSINGLLLIELLFGDTYGAFAERASRSNRFGYMLEPYDTRSADSFDELAQSFLNAAYEAVIYRGETPKRPPDFYGIVAPASTKTPGWPVYFFAVGMGLKLPPEGHRGKVGLPRG
jgi:hypothetical protein